MTFHKFVGADPIHKVGPALPHREDNIRIAFVDRAQNLVGDEPFHLIDEARALAKHFLERVCKLRLYVEAVGDSNHLISLGSDKRWLVPERMNWRGNATAAADEL